MIYKLLTPLIVVYIYIYTKILTKVHYHIKKNYYFQQQTIF